MKTSISNIKNASIIDFTGTTKTGQHFCSFGADVVAQIRRVSEPKVVVIVDRGYGLAGNDLYVVKDHLNLTGTNPLVGPNDAIGERFPSVNGVYINDLPLTLKGGVAAGLKQGVVPTERQWSFVRSLGADFYCYNLVPAMIVAAHAGCRVLGIVLPEGVSFEMNLDSLLR